MRARRIQDRKQDFVRGEIWTAAVDLFSSRGYDATTVEEIAAAAGVSRRTFFRYYASKDDLMVKAIDSYGDLLTAAVRGADPGAPPLEIVRQAVAHVAGVVVAQPRIRETMAISVGSAAARRAQLAELEIVTDRLAGTFARVLGRRARRRHTARLMASLTVTVLTLTFRAWYDRRPPSVGAIVEDMLASVADLLDRSAGARSGGRPRRRRRGAGQ